MDSIGIIHRGRANYYLNNQHEKYYASESEAPGFFYGSGAQSFGIDADDIKHQDSRLKNLFNGLSPDGSITMRRGGSTVRTYIDKKTGEEKKHNPTLAYDHCFSAPKDVSVLMMMLPEHESQKLVNLHNQAAKKAMDYLDQNATYTRSTQTQPDGSRKTFWHQAKSTFACFTHITSRAKDMQLHTHCVQINSGERLDGKGYGAVDGKKTLQARYTAGQIYLSDLRRSLEKEYGIKTFDRQFSNDSGCSFGIHGISGKVTKHFSKRSLEIKEKTKENMSAAQIRNIVLKSRKAKDHNQDIGELKRQWRRELKQMGCSLKNVINQQKAKTMRSTSYDNEIASVLAKRKDESFNKHHVLNATIKVADGELSVDRAKAISDLFMAKYAQANEQDADKFILTDKAKEISTTKDRTKTQKAIEIARQIILWHREKRQAVLDKKFEKKEREFKKFQKKSFVLYMKGNISHQQYLLIKEDSRIMKASKFTLNTYQALGLLKKQQLDRVLNQRKKEENEYYNIFIAQKKGFISEEQAKELRIAEWRRRESAKEQEQDRGRERAR